MNAWGVFFRNRRRGSRGHLYKGQGAVMRGIRAGAGAPRLAIGVLALFGALTLGARADDKPKEDKPKADKPPMPKADTPPRPREKTYTIAWEKKPWTQVLAWLSEETELPYVSP